MSLPIPKPTGWHNGSDYKISFSVEKDRFLNGWLPVIGPELNEPPLIDITFTYSGDSIHSLEAEYVPTTPARKAEMMLESLLPVPVSCMERLKMFAFVQPISAARYF